MTRFAALLFGSFSEAVENAIFNCIFRLTVTQDSKSQEIQTSLILLTWQVMLRKQLLLAQLTHLSSETASPKTGQNVRKPPKPQKNFTDL